MGTALVILGWTAVSCTVRIALVNMPRLCRRMHIGEVLVPDAGWLLPELCGCGSLSLLSLLGVVPALPGALLSAALFLAAVLPDALLMRKASRLRDAEGKNQGGPVARRIIGGRLRIIRGIPMFIGADLRLLTGRHREEDGYEPGRDATAAAPASAPARTVPAPARPPAAPGQAPPPQPAPPAPADDSPAAAAIPPGWAGLCAEISGFEADTDEEVLGFLAAQLAGHMAHAESVRDLADRLLHGAGLDPAFAQGVAEYADENADMTGGVAVLDRQFHAIYDTLRAWADEHPMGMPHRAREFLQGGEQPLPEAGDDGIAA